MRAAADVFLVRDGRVLLLHRAPEDWGGIFGDLWHIPGGMGEDGEAPDETAARETLEETGLAVTGLRELRTFTHDYRGGIARITTFVADAPDGEPVLDHEHTAWKWAAPAELLDYLDSDTIAGRGEASSDFHSWRGAWREVVVALIDDLQKCGS